MIDELGRAGKLDRYHLFHAARADLLSRLNERQAAIRAYRAALELTTNAAERSFIARRIAMLERG